MSRLQAWLVHSSTLLVGGTGLVYAWMRYLAVPNDPFAVVNHPWQPAVQHLHLWAAPLLVFAAGVIWHEHVWSHWRRGVVARRRSGLSLVATLLPMVASGYLIQTAVDPAWRRAWVVIHLVASGLWLAGYLVHQVVPWVQRRRRLAHRGHRLESSAGSVAGLVALVMGATLLAAGCSRRDEAPAEDAAKPVAGPVTLACGLEEGVIGPLLARFTATTGYEVRAHYGDSSELADDLLDTTEPPAQLFLSRDAPDLGRVAAAGLFRPLPADVLSRVEDHFADPEGRWVGLTGRVRAVVYAGDRTGPEGLPQDLTALADPRFRGRIGVASGSDAFVDHVSVYRALNGAAQLTSLLEGLVANEAKSYPDEKAVVAAVLDGDLDFGLADHDVALAAVAGQTESPLVLRLLPSGDASGFVNLSGLGLISENPAALDLVRYLLSAASQRELAQETAQYPLVAEVPLPAAPAPLAELSIPRIDFAEVASQRAATREAIADSGLGSPP